MAMAIPNNPSAKRITVQIPTKVEGNRRARSIRTLGCAVNRTASDSERVKDSTCDMKSVPSAVADGSKTQLEID